MSKKKRSRGNRHKRANNILVFKLVDPIFQSLLFILFIYSIDTDYINNGGIPYRTILMALIGLQFLSFVINFFIKEETQLKNERLLYLATLVIYFLSFYFIQRMVNPKYIEVITGMGKEKLDFTEIALMTVAIIISFWYFVICFREIRDMLKSDNSED